MTISALILRSRKKTILKTNPKLCRFPGRYGWFTFMDFLGYGVQGYVFKALYRGKFVGIKSVSRTHLPTKLSQADCVNSSDDMYRTFRRMASSTIQLLFAIRE